jgi:hypothetical protein
MRFPRVLRLPLVLAAALAVGALATLAFTDRPAQAPATGARAQPATTTAPRRPGFQRTLTVGAGREPAPSASATRMPAVLTARHAAAQRGPGDGAHRLGLRARRQGRVALPQPAAPARRLGDHRPPPAPDA